MGLRGDLHCHSTYSDGTCNLWELALFAKISKLDVLALSDHDTTAGVEKLRALATEHGIRIVPAMEISCRDYKRDRMVHMLCYYPREKTLEIARQTSAMCIANRVESIKRMQADYPISLEHVLRLQGDAVTLYHRHIRYAFEQMGYCMSGDMEFSHMLLKKYSQKIPYPDVLDVVHAIREEGSIAVIAHPGEFDSLDLAEELAAQGLIHGLERNHPRNSEQTKQQVDEICAKYGLLTTGGTDFHGAANETQNTIGTFLTPEDSLQKILSHAGAY